MILKDYVRLSVRLKVIPEDEKKIFDLLKRYRSALNFSIQYISKNYKVHRLAKTVPLAIKIQKNLYPILRNTFGLPSYIANSCILDALIRIKIRKVQKNRPIKSLSMLMIPAGYYISGDYIKIFGVGKLKIIGKDYRYLSYRDRLAKLVYKGGEMYFFISKKVPIPKPELYDNVLIMVLDKDYLYYGNNNFVNKIKLIALDRALHYIDLAEKLKKKYPKAWRRRRGIYNRIISYYRKADNIIDDFAKQTALRLVKFAKQNKYSYSIEKWGIQHIVRQFAFRSFWTPIDNPRGQLLLKLSKKLYKWITIQGRKNGAFTFSVKRLFNDLICPKCHSKMKVYVYQKYAICKVCGYVEDKNILYIKQSESIVKETLSKYKSNIEK